MASRTAVPCRAATSLKSGGSPSLSHSRPPPVRPHTPAHKGKGNAGTEGEAEAR
jgi:hypothetical protein